MVEGHAVVMKRFLVAAVLPLTMVVVPVGVLASAAANHAKAPKPPKSGHWMLNNNEDEPGVMENSGGVFTVTAKHRDVKNLSVIIGPDAETACGTGTVRVLGKQAIRNIKGETDFGGTYDEWIVGKPHADAAPPYTPDKVKLHRAGKVFKGGLEMNFAGPTGGTKKKPSIGTITYKGPKKFGGSCSLNFGYNKK
jgi:hypothetical protein